IGHRRPRRQSPDQSRLRPLSRQGKNRDPQLRREKSLITPKPAPTRPSSSPRKGSITTSIFTRSIEFGSRLPLFVHGSRYASTSPTPVERFLPATIAV